MEPALLDTDASLRVLRRSRWLSLLGLLGSLRLLGPCGLLHTEDQWVADRCLWRYVQRYV